MWFSMCSTDPGMSSFVGDMNIKTLPSGGSLYQTSDAGVTLGAVIALSSPLVRHNTPIAIELADSHPSSQSLPLRLPLLLPTFVTTSAIFALVNIGDEHLWMGDLCTCTRTSCVQVRARSSFHSTALPRHSSPFLSA